MPSSLCIVANLEVRMYYRCFVLYVLLFFNLLSTLAIEMLKLKNCSNHFISRATMYTNILMVYQLT